MYKILATLAALVLLGGCIAPATCAPIAVIPTDSTLYTTSFESVVTAVTTGDSPALDINTTITNQTVKHPQRRLYSPRRGAHAGGKW